MFLPSHNHPNSTVALPSIGGPTLAESIRAKEAGEAFREHRAALLIAVTDPLILANSLYSSRIISREILDRVRLPMLTSTEKNMDIFDAIEAQIRTNPSHFSTLLDILNNDPQLCMFTERVQQSYGECYYSSHICSHTYERGPTNVCPSNPPPTTSFTSISCESLILTRVPV